MGSESDQPNNVETTETTPDSSFTFGRRLAVPGMLVAHAPEGGCSTDRFVVAPPFTVGRGAENNFAVDDGKVSKNHFRIVGRHGGFRIEDLESTNGTFVDGERVVGGRDLAGPAVIRAGNVILVFQSDVSPFLAPLPMNRFDMAGSFHAPVLTKALQDAAISVRHILLTGPSGSGKELAARAVFSMMKRDGKAPFVVHNAARFSNEEEAATTLFGVAARVFSNVDARTGLIEQATGGVLFLDEVHNLPVRVQRTLLRIIEDRQMSRIGETVTRPVDVSFVFASNVPGEHCGLAHDLFARLRAVRIPALKERVADIPEIFENILGRTLRSYGIEVGSVQQKLSADHFEALALDGFEADNVRGIVDVADRIGTQIASGEDVAFSIANVFGERFKDSPVARRKSEGEVTGAVHYQYNREIIVAAYKECNGNMSAVERLLKSKGLRCSRRWLTHYLELWGIKPLS